NVNSQAASSAYARVRTQERCVAPVAPAAAPAARAQAAQPPEVMALLGKVGGLQTRLREDQDEAKKYKELATRVENATQAQLSSMADQVRELDRQQRSHQEEVAKVEQRYQVEVAAHVQGPGDRYAAIPGRRPRLLELGQCALPRDEWAGLRVRPLLDPEDLEQCPNKSSRMGELDRAIRSFWQKYAHSIWNRSFMTSSGAAERVVEALMGSLLGIAGSLFRVVQAYGVQLL
ncbi:hypothetical protein DYB36_012565, partial [Aphanomyces astaci]